MLRPGHHLDPRALIGALLDKRVVPLSHSISRSCSVEGVTISSRQGIAIYRRTACLMLMWSFRDLFPKVHVVVGQSLEGGFHFEWSGTPTFSSRRLARVEQRMREIASRSVPIKQEEMPAGEAHRLLESHGRSEEARLLEYARQRPVTIVWWEGIPWIGLDAIAYHTGFLERGFELMPYKPGFILRFPDLKRPGEIRPLRGQEKLFRAYRETRQWNRVVGIRDVPHLNLHIADGTIHELIQVSEAQHEKKIAAIADQIQRESQCARIVLIAGPSASGKTTFAKRLRIQLRVNGLSPVTLSLDDYFKNRVDTPRTPQGEYDFEALEALDVPLLNEHLVALLQGRQAMIPRYDFKSGTRQEGHSLKIGKKEILIIEGIHGLNPELTPRVPREQKIRIYVSALSQIALNSYHRIFTSDARLLRRIVRDRQFRGYTAFDTLRRWPLVLAGEARHIFPFQEQADIIFNSALVYETSAMCVPAREALSTVDSTSPEYTEASRMLDFVDLFLPVSGEGIPPTSILREFLGGSSFKY